MLLAAPFTGWLNVWVARAIFVVGLVAIFIGFYAEWKLHKRKTITNEDTLKKAICDYAAKSEEEINARWILRLTKMPQDFPLRPKAEAYMRKVAEETRLLHDALQSQIIMAGSPYRVHLTEYVKEVESIIVKTILPSTIETEDMLKIQLQVATTAILEYLRVVPEVKK